MYLNIVVGIGGTGQEVIDYVNRIAARYPFQDNIYEWFVLDTSTVLDGIRTFGNDHDHFIRMTGFDSSKMVIQELEQRNKDINIKEMFPEGDYLRNNTISTVGGAWELRKLGLLALIHHLIRFPDDNIITRIRRVIEGTAKGRLAGIRLFYIASLAGGTGSGICLPLCALLRNSLQGIARIEAYALLAMPDMVALGSRNPGETSQRKFKANAYQALHELQSLWQTDRPAWVVKMGAIGGFDVREIAWDIYDGVFLYTATNTRAANLVGAGDAYTQYFQLMAWSAYTFASGNEVFRGRVQQNFVGSSRFTGMGVYVLEFPEESIVSKVAATYFDKLPLYLSSLKNPAKSGKKEADAYKLPIDDYRAALGDPNPQREQKAEFATQLANAMKGQEIQTLKNMWPQQRFSEVLDVEVWIRNYRSSLLRKIQDLLRDGYAVQDLLEFFLALTEGTQKALSAAISKRNESRNRVENARRSIQGHAKPARVREEKERYFGLIWSLNAEERVVQLCEEIARDLGRMEEFVEDILGMLSKASLANQVYTEDPYFAHPPPCYVLAGTLENAVDEFSGEFLAKYAPPGGLPRLEEKEMQLLQRFWNDYSRNELNGLIWGWFQQYQVEGRGNWMKDQSLKKSALIEWSRKALKEFILRSHRDLLQDHNLLHERLSPQGRILQETEKMSAPFVCLRETVPDQDGQKWVACGPGHGRQLRDGGARSSRSYFDMLSSDNLLIFFNIKGGISMRELQIDDLKRAYEDRRKQDEEDKHVFLHPCFAEN